jgi:hypothetical protein
VPKPVTGERGENRQPRTTTKLIVNSILNIDNKARLRLVLRMCELQFNEGILTNVNIVLTSRKIM